jgi:hypothetical protein
VMLQLATFHAKSKGCQFVSSLVATMEATTTTIASPSDVETLHTRIVVGAVPQHCRSAHTVLGLPSFTWGLGCCCLTQCQQHSTSLILVQQTSKPMQTRIELRDACVTCSRRWHRQKNTLLLIRRLTFVLWVAFA